MSTPGEAAAPPSPPAAPPATKKGFWETAGARIGIASAILGLVVAVLGLPAKITGALRDIGVGVDPALAAQVEESRPILEVKYVLLTDDLLGWRQYRGLDDSNPDSTASAATHTEKARTLLSLPLVLTEAGDDSDLLEPAADDMVMRQTAFLFIENRGKRDATNVTLHAEQLTFAASPHVRENGGGDYVAILRRGSTATTQVSVTVPQTLAPGDAVLVPVFVSGSAPGRFHEWSVLSRSALLPDSLTFTDAVIQRPRSAPVRRMVNPTLVERGILDRG